MKKSLFSIIDITGILLPGFLFMFSIMILCIDDIKKMQLVNHLIEGGNIEFLKLLISATFSLLVLLAIAYILGFILRLISISVLEKITYPFWTKKLKEITILLNPHVKEIIDDDELCNTIKEVSSYDSKYMLAPSAIYFQYLKRVLRGSKPNLWAEVEGHEATMRIISGMFFPFILLAITSIIYIVSNQGSLIFYSLCSISIISIIVIIYIFPRRRIREAVYVYYTAIACIKYDLFA